jgi:hypothetical protein
MHQLTSSGYSWRTRYFPTLGEHRKPLLAGIREAHQLIYTLHPPPLITEAPPLEKGDTVWLHNDQNHQSDKNISPKLIPRYIGSSTVINIISPLRYDIAESKSTHQDVDIRVTYQTKPNQTQRVWIWFGFGLARSTSEARIELQVTKGERQNEMLSAAWKARLPFIYIINWISDNYTSN